MIHTTTRTDEPEHAPPQDDGVLAGLTGASSSYLPHCDRARRRCRGWSAKALPPASCTQSHPFRVIAVGSTVCPGIKPSSEGFRHHAMERNHRFCVLAVPLKGDKRMAPLIACRCPASDSASAEISAVGSVDPTDNRYNSPLRESTQQATVQRANVEDARRNRIWEIGTTICPPGALASVGVKYAGISPEYTLHTVVYSAFFLSRGFKSVWRRCYLNCVTLPWESRPEGLLLYR